jgi:hypothetical protein
MHFLNFHTVHFCSVFVNNQQMRWFLVVYYFILPLLHVSTHTCQSSGSSSVPAELHANRKEWLIRLCVIRDYMSVMWRSGVHQSVYTRPPHNRHITTYNAESKAAFTRVPQVDQRGWINQSEPCKQFPSTKVINGVEKVGDGQLSSTLLIHFGWLTTYYCVNKQVTTCSPV